MTSKKREYYVLIVISLILIVLISCTPKPLPAPIEELPSDIIEPAANPVINETQELPQETEPMLPAATTCTYTADCPANLECIDQQCQQLTQLYPTECTTKCSVDEIVVDTSDGETYTLRRGQGSYTAAGALEWQLIPPAQYCPLERLPIPIKIIKKTTGQTLGEQIITVEEGATSDVVDHPRIPNIQFTVTLKSVQEICG